MTIILKHLPSADGILFERPSLSYQQKLDKILDTCDTKNGGYVCLNVSRPRKPRTTGELSQNNLVWKLITLIANEVGDNSEKMKDTESGLKNRALSKGYPYHLNKLTGEVVPESMTTIDTIQCSYLIDTAYEICAELGIVIPPNING